MATTPNGYFEYIDGPLGGVDENGDSFIKKLQAFQTTNDTLIDGIVGGGMTNPMTTLGDIIRGAATGTPQRLAVGSAGQVLTVVSGEPVWATPAALGADLTAIEALSGTGFAVRTAANTWAQRTITGTAQQIAVANGDGVSGNPTLSIPSDAQLSIETLEATIEIVTVDVQSENVYANTLVFNGATSGQVTIQPAADAGTWALTLPVNNGDSGQALVTNGSGITSWETVLTGNQTITLSGDVTGSGATAITATIAAQNSAFWRGKVTDETGSGLWVFNDSPTLITPVLGAATGLSLVLSGSLSADSVTGAAQVVSSAHITTGLTSGEVKIQSDTGTWTLTLPVDDGTSGQVLTTNGSGVTSWATPTPAGANTALSNLASVAINTSLLLGANGTIDIGDATNGLDDIFFSSGSVLNFNNGDVLITHSANLLTISGGALALEDLTVSNNATINGDLDGVEVLTVKTEAIPDANDGAILGSATRQWSDLFLASGAVVNFDNGDITITHAANALAFAGATVGYSFDNIVTVSELIVDAGITTPGISVEGIAIVESLQLPGATSGIVTIQPAAIAGTWTLTLPTNDGTSGQVLTTDGNGATSWSTISGGGGGDALTTQPLSQFAATTSAQLAGVLSDESGSSGGFVRAVGAAISALTGLGIRSTGAAFDLTIASSEVLSAGRTLSIVLNDAARTLTIPGSTTIPIASQALTFTGPTAARTITLPDAAFSVARIDAAQTFTGNQTFSGLILAGSGPTTLTDAAGKILSASLNTVAVAQGGTGGTTAATGRAGLGLDTANTPQFAKIGIGAAADASAHLLISAATVPNQRFTWTDNTSLGAITMYESSNIQAAWQQIGSNFGTVARRGDMEFVNFIATGKISFWTNSTDRFHVEADGGVTVGAPTGGSKGAGSINAVTVWRNGTALDFVFEPNYSLLTIDEMIAFFKEEKHLPTIDTRKVHDNGSTNEGALVDALWETVECQAVYISELHERLKAVEERPKEH